MKRSLHNELKVLFSLYITIEKKSMLYLCCGKFESTVSSFLFHLSNFRNISVISKKPCNVTFPGSVWDLNKIFDNFQKLLFEVHFKKKSQGRKQTYFNPKISFLQWTDCQIGLWIAKKVNLSFGILKLRLHYYFVQFLHCWKTCYTMLWDQNEKRTQD